MIHRILRALVAALALCAGTAYAQSLADLAITKTDGATSVTAGTPVTYTITATNAGPSGVTGATVADTLPAAITGATWTCVGAGGGSCTASGSGNLNDLVNLPAGASVTYTLTASNAGPVAVTGATVADTLPASLSGVTWTCVGSAGGTCTASGSGNLNELVNLPVGAAVTFTITGALSASATGTLSNTATITAPGGVTDPNAANNTATDTDTISAVPVASTPQAVPTLSELALVLLGALMGLTWWRRQRKA